MGTRATYKIEGHFFYIHWDGYLEGAATYFLNMLSTQSKGGYAEAFLRGNDQASFTESHDAHGDTEYRYDYDGKVLKAYKGNWDNDEWELVFEGSIVKFISEYAETLIVSLPYEVLPIDLALSSMSSTLAETKRFVDSGHTGNASSSARDLRKICVAIISALEENDPVKMGKSPISYNDFTDYMKKAAKCLSYAVENI